MILGTVAATGDEKQALPTRLGVSPDKPFTVDFETGRYSGQGADQSSMVHRTGLGDNFLYRTCECRTNLKLLFNDAILCRSLYVIVTDDYT